MRGERANPSTDDLDASLVRAQLERMLANEIFSRSERLSTYLRFVVEQSLAGRGDALKEQIIAAELYDKRFGFDPSGDATVRVDARRLRDKLREYYTVCDRDPIVISLQKGSLQAGI